MNTCRAPHLQTSPKQTTITAKRQQTTTSANARTAGLQSNRHRLLLLHEQFTVKQTPTTANARTVYSQTDNDFC